MSGTEDANQSLVGNPSLSLESLAQLISNMSDAFNSQLDNVSRKFGELDARLDELCLRIDDNDSEVNVKFTQFQSSVNKDLIAIQNENSQQQQRTQESQKCAINSQRALSDTIRALGDRISLVEGQSARLAALENKFQNSVPLVSPPITCSQSMPQVSFNSILTSTTVAHPIPTQSAIPSNTSSFSAPNYNISFPNQTTSTINNTTLSNSTGISLDSAKLPPYDGQLIPVHPEEFIEQAEQYFLTQPPVPDNVKINYIKSKFVEGARLWYTTLLPPPTNYQDFLVLFRNQFWSPNQQRAIRNELYRPYFHRDSISLQKHAMDWISKARFLQPPIDQAEMVDQITSHFTFNISIALRGLRITTTNELVQQLSHIQQAHSPPNNQNSQNAPSYQNQNSQNAPSYQNQNRNSFNNSSGPNQQHRYSPRQNNYQRPQYNSQNQSAPTPPTTTPPPEN
ncbi:unnamed protein product [Macrosiphum euphorbiae]|uniref:Retrotransposon gag domain-containing protein n=1 Tax=Macrosiphum euphorbiae TaxID=13131 RepID=A0AAV0XQ16_9HEMI|nr:unnamed protein product [Macrosiphum euphorbiae]